MGLKLILLLSIALVLAVHWGRRHNLLLATRLLRIVDESFPIVRKDSVILGHGLGYGIDYELEGPYPSLKVVLTLLPRYAPMYLPIAYLIGRRDLLKLTFEGGPVSTGVGAILRDCGDSQLPFDRDTDMSEQEVTADDQVYRVYAFNPYVARMLKTAIPFLVDIPTFRYLSVDSRTGTVTAYLVPRVDSLSTDLAAIGTTIESIRTN